MNSIGVLIPLLGITCGIIAVICGYLIKSQKMKLDMMREQRGSDASNGEVVAELHRLKDRVAVLDVFQRVRAIDLMLVECIDVGS